VKDHRPCVIPKFLLVRGVELWSQLGDLGSILIEVNYGADFFKKVFSPVKPGFRGTHFCSLSSSYISSRNSGH
jgi:hypothetical protein